MNFKDLGASYIRTYVPVIIGWLLTFAAGVLDKLQDFGLNVDSAQAKSAVTVAVIGLYYGAVRLLEMKFPKAGWLLGLPSQPQYPVPPTP